MARRKSVSYAELFSKEKERVLDQQAKAMAGQEGIPAFSRKASPQLEDEAWDATDPAVTMEHFAQIAAATVQELSQQRDPQGRPMWDFEAIEAAVKYRQTMALHPYREMTFTTGLPADDYENHVREANRIAKRRMAPQAMPMMAGADQEWSQPVDESEVMAQPPMGQQPQQPMQQESSDVFGEEY